VASPLFAALINIREPARLSLAYLTDVITGDDDTEQRIQLRSIAARRESYLVSAYDGPNHSHLDRALYAQQGTRFTVPSWLDQTRLTSAVLAGATSLPCVTTDRGFTAGEFAVLWASPTSHEVVEVTAVGGAALTVTPTVGAWASDAIVLPGRTGRLVSDLRNTRINQRATDLPVSFEIETVVTYGVDGESGDEGGEFLLAGGDFITYGGAFVLTDTETYVNRSGDILTHNGDHVLYSE
jgi:hypothetical protein